MSPDEDALIRKVCGMVAAVHKALGHIDGVGTPDPGLAYTAVSLAMADMAVNAGMTIQAHAEAALQAFDTVADLAASRAAIAAKPRN